MKARFKNYEQFIGSQNLIDELCCKTFFCEIVSLNYYYFFCTVYCV